MRKPKTFRQDHDVEGYLSNLEYGDATGVINEAIREYAMSKSGDPVAEQEKPARPGSPGTPKGSGLEAELPLRQRYERGLGDVDDPGNEDTGEPNTDPPPPGGSETSPGFQAALEKTEQALDSAPAVAPVTAKASPRARPNSSGRQDSQSKNSSNFREPSRTPESPSSATDSTTTPGLKFLHGKPRNTRG